MARWIVGNTIEYRRVEIRAQGVLSPAECVTDPTACCSGTPDPTGGVGGATCCPDADLAATIAAASSGPIGFNGAICESDWTLTRDTDADGAFWAGASSTGVGVHTCFGVELSARLWCRKDADGVAQWFASGDYIDGDLERHFFGPIALTDDGEHLTGEAGVPGEGEPLTLVFARPCSTPHSFNCVDGTCVSVLGTGGTYATAELCAAACGTTPGSSDCATALAAGGLGLGTNIVSTFKAPGVQEWWYIGSLPAGTYRLVLASGIDAASINQALTVFTGSCSGLDFPVSMNASLQTCGDFTLGSTTPVFFRTLNSGFGGVGDPFTVRVESGACPP